MYKIEFLDIEENNEYEKTISKVLEECFKVENLPEDKLLVSITLTNPENIRKLNKEFKDLEHGFGAAIGYSMINDGIKTIDDAINEATLDMRNNKEEN